MRRCPFAALVVVAVALLAIPVRALVQRPESAAPASRQANPDGWQIPPGAADEKNPVAVGDKVLAKGKALYRANCQRCHGASGTGDGPDADPEHRPEDLTDPGRAARNPDGVMFYKIWNGRLQPKMPAFKADMTHEEVWTVIHFAKTLRK